MAPDLGFDQPTVTRRTIIVVVTAILVVMAAGSGVVHLLDGPQQPPNVGPADVSDRTTTVEPPTTTEPEDTTGTTTEPAADLDPTLTASVSGFDDVRTRDGDVPGLVGRLAGSLGWSNGSVDRAELVVHAWIPRAGWRTVDRTTVAPSTQNVSLEEAFEGTGFVYASGENASAFANPEDGTTVVRRGFVSVTARLYTDGRQVGQARTIESSSFGVTNLAETADSADGHPAVVLRGDRANPTVFTAENAAPGVRGSGQLTVGNPGADEGALRVTASNLTSAENGHTEPESHVDDDATSELPEHLLLRVSLHDGDTTVYVVGSAERMVAYGSLGRKDFAVDRPLAAGENVTLLVEWYVDPAAGNDIQTDSVSLDFEFTLADDDQELLDSVTVSPAKDIGSVSRLVGVRGKHDEQLDEPEGSNR